MKTALNPEELNLTADEVIINGITSGFHSISRLKEVTTPELIHSEIAKLVPKVVIKAQRGKLDFSSLEEFAYFAGQKRAKEILNSSPIERERISDLAKAELERLIPGLLQRNTRNYDFNGADDGGSEISERSLTPSQREALRYFKHIYLEDKRDPEISYLFPNTSRDQRYQWKTRAIRMLNPLVSEDAQKFISWKSRSKAASADELLQAANIFLTKCLVEG